MEKARIKTKMIEAHVTGAHVAKKSDASHVFV